MDAQASSKCVKGFFLAAALVVFVIYKRRIKSPALNYNSTVVMLFTLTMCCFSRSAAVHRPSNCFMMVFYLFSELGKTIHILISCEGLHTLIKMCFPLHQQLRSFSLTLLFLWLTFTAAFSNSNLNHRPVEDGGRAMLRFWTLLEFLAFLHSVFVFFPFLLQFILTKLNYLCVLLHLQLVICQQNSRLPTQYVVVIRINRLI